MTIFLRIEYICMKRLLKWHRLHGVRLRLVMSMAQLVMGCTMALEKPDMVWTEASSWSHM